MSLKPNLTRSNVRERVMHGVCSKEQLQKYFGITDSDRKKSNKLDELIEAERKNGIIELTSNNHYIISGGYDEQGNRELSNETVAATL